MVHTCSDCGQMHVWFVDLSPTTIGGTDELHLLIPYIPALPYWACSMEIVVPGGHFNVIVSSSQTARWKVFNVPDNRAIKLKEKKRRKKMRTMQDLFKKKKKRKKKSVGPIDQSWKKNTLLKLCNYMLF